jgi:hypothetical protein
LHDDGEKTVLGRTGRFNGDDVLEILLAHPATARFVVSKLWREFVSPQPDPARVEVITQRLRVAEWVFLASDARRRLTELGISPPADDGRKYVIMGKRFDPAQADAYLSSFAIRRTN